MESAPPATRVPRRRDVLLRRAWIALVALALAALSIVLYLQNQRIDTLEHRAPVPGPVGPSGPPGPSGPQGAPGVQLSPAGQQQTTALSELQAQAYCQDLARKAWPNPTNTDAMIQQLGQAYASTMRQKAFDTCMAGQGFPQQ
jgi:hypothetical protein